MTPYEIALSYLGEQEIEGNLHNQVIVAMFASVGHPEIHDDETAWCAAFVGHCIEVSGLKSTRALNARSYRSWGDPVPDIELAKDGDIVVFKRGNSTWQGHVGFFVGPHSAQKREEEKKAKRRERREQKKKREKTKRKAKKNVPPPGIEPGSCG